MYTNKINGKKYIGQTIRSLSKRHTQHLCQHEIYIDKAIQKYGEDNFTLEILEDNIYDKETLNKREVYYIEKYNTFNDGYNLSRGGESHTRFDLEKRNKIANMIKNTELSFAEIGRETGTSIYTVSDINKGHVLPQPGEKFPIRKVRCTQYSSQETIDEVINLLIETDFTFNKIADLTGTNFNFVADINKGKRVFMIKENITFPIRSNPTHCEMTMELANKIIKMLKEYDKSAEEIGNQLNIPAYTVGQINRGKAAICKQINETYPIRKKQYKSNKNYSCRKISNSQLIEIIELLLNTILSLEEISRRYDVTRVSIDRINQGKVFKSELTLYKFPIRQNKQYNLPIFNNAKV